MDKGISSTDMFLRYMSYKATKIKQNQPYRDYRSYVWFVVMVMGY